MIDKINVSELLLHCPKGMELDCTMYDNCTFEGIEDVGYIDILVKTPSGIIRLTKEGCYIRHDDYAKCVIFPKGKTTWEGFVPPCQFKDGDIAVSDKGDIHLLRTIDSSYCVYRESWVRWECLPKFDETPTTSVRVVRLATEEEKAKLFQAIKDNGYKWNPETKTLEPKQKPITLSDVINAINEGCKSLMEETIKIDIPKGYEFAGVDDDNQHVVFTKIGYHYPKTYEECCEVLGVNPSFDIKILGVGESTLYFNFIDLVRCRNAYWKIAGEQMGLGKPWKPDWKDSNFKYCLKKMGDNIEKSSEMTISCILAFPTEEMQDAFYENFKDLIEQCKELL